MKKHILTIGIMLAVRVLMAQSLQFSSTEYRFPTMRVTGAETACEFSFVNKSSDKIYITRANYSQKNIRVTWGKDTIGKKESGTITVIINPKNSVGSFACPIKISTLEKGKAVEYTLTVTGEILEREKTKQEIYGMKEGNLRYISNYKVGYKLSPATELIDTFFFYNEWTETMTFSAGNLPPSLDLVYLTPKAAPLEEGILVFRFKAGVKNDWGSIYEQFIMTTNDPDRPNKTFYMTGDIYDDFSSWTPEQLKNAPKLKAIEEKYNFGTVVEETIVEHTFVITNVGKSTLYIRKTKTSCGCTAGLPEKNVLEPNESTIVKASFRTHRKTGNQSTPIYIISNDPENPKVTVTMEGYVTPKPAE
jgi:hypothetical protein